MFYFHTRTLFVVTLAGVLIILIFFGPDDCLSANCKEDIQELSKELYQLKFLKYQRANSTEAGMVRERKPLLNRASARMWRVTAKLDLTPEFHTCCLGNQMFIFQSTIGIAVHNGARAVFDRGQLAMLQKTFNLSDIANLFAVEDNLDQGPRNFPVIMRLDTPRHERPSIPNITKDTRVGEYLQNKDFFAPINMYAQHFWKFRQEVLTTARSVFPGPGRYVGVHIRKMPAGHLSLGLDFCPSSSQLQGLIDTLSKEGKCILVFSNDVQFARSMVKAPCIRFVENGPAHMTSANELRPDHNAGRDIAALSLCEDVVTTCGTYGLWASLLHSGNGSVYFFKGDYRTTAVELHANKWKSYQ